MTTDSLTKLKYVAYAKRREEGLLVVGLSGAAGRALDLALFVRTRKGEYKDLFANLQLSNNPTIFADIDGDGIYDLVTVENCRLHMYRLEAGLWDISYAEASIKHEQVLERLEKALLGRELLVYFSRWAEAGCPDQVEDGGAFFDQLNALTAHELERIRRFERALDNSPLNKSANKAVERDAPKAARPSP